LSSLHSFPTRRSSDLFSEFIDVDRGECLFKESVREPPFRQTAMQRHLAAFKSPLLMASRAGPHALAATSRRLPMPRARTAPDSLDRKSTRLNSSHVSI